VAGAAGGPWEVEWPELAVRLDRPRLRTLTRRRVTGASPPAGAAPAPSPFAELLVTRRVGDLPREPVPRSESLLGTRLRSTSST
jgi:hypothetical protein